MRQQILAKKTKFRPKKRQVMRSNPAHDNLLFFRSENILRANLNFMTFYGPLPDLKLL